jgi:hypothetical protein
VQGQVETDSGNVPGNNEWQRVILAELYAKVWSEPIVKIDGTWHFGHGLSVQRLGFICPIQLTERAVLGSLNGVRIAVVSVFARCAATVGETLSFIRHSLTSSRFASAMALASSNAVTTITGVLAIAGFLLTSRRVARPSISGISRSSNTRSTISRFRICRHSSADRAVKSA